MCVCSRRSTGTGSDTRNFTHLPKHNNTMKHAGTMSTGDATGDAMRERSTGDATEDGTDGERATPRDRKLLRV